MKELANNSTNEDLIEFAKEQCEIFPEDSYMGKYLRETLKMLQAESCEDCVSRKSLIHKLQERHDFFVDAYGGFGNLPQKDKARVDAIATCIAMVVNEPPVIPTQKWIPVSERLPENETCVLTTIKIPNRIARVRSGWYDSGFIHNDNGDVWKTTDMEVLAWMPLPKPYKESEKA